MSENFVRKVTARLIIPSWPWIRINMSGKYKPKCDSLQLLQILAFVRFVFAVQLNNLINATKNCLIELIKLFNFFLFEKSFFWWCKIFMCIKPLVSAALSVQAHQNFRVYFEKVPFSRKVKVAFIFEIFFSVWDFFRRATFSV